MTRTATAPIATAPAARRGVGPVRSSGIFIGRSLRHSLRDGEGMIMAIVLPVLLMFVFTYIFGGAIKAEGYVDFVVPGVILICASFGAAGVAVSVNRDVTLGAMRRFRTLPIHSATVLAGHVVASLLRNLVATGIVIGVAVLIGFRPTATPAQWLVALTLVAVWILAITALFAFIGLVSSTPKPPTATASPSCSYPTSPAHSCPSTRCPPGCGRSRPTSRSTRSSSRSAHCSWIRERRSSASRSLGASASRRSRRR